MSLDVPTLVAELNRIFGPETPSGGAPVSAVASAPGSPAAGSAAAVPGETPAEAVPQAPPPPCREVDYGARGWHVDLQVPPDRVVEAAQVLDRHGFMLEAVTGVDWMAQSQMEVVYDYVLWEPTLRVVVRTRVPRDAAELPTVSAVHPGANWHERETHEFFGIRFTGHPDLSPLLLPEDATYHPLRKDFVA